jgi:putative peptidoglycan binding protein
MKIKRIISLIVGITSVALSPMTSAAGHGGGGGGGGGGEGFGGGSFSGSHSGAGRGGGSGGRHFGGGIQRPALSNGTLNHGAMPSATRSSQAFSQRGLNGRTDHIAERHEASWHGDWDRRHAHFDHDRFFVFIDGFWCGLDDGFFPWDYLPYYPNDYYPYDYYADVDPYDNGATSNIAPADSATVQAVQTRLLNLGYYDGSIDGVFGPSTRDAVAKYQMANQLNVTGSLSPDTLQSLGLPQPAAS